MDVIVRALRDVELFDRLQPLQLTEIARTADRIVYQPGDVLIAKDQQCDAAILIIDGEPVQLRDEADAPTERVISPGSLIAEMAMVVDIEASATVVAQTKVRAVRITRASMLALFNEDPEVADALLDKIMSRLRHVSDQLKLIDEQIEQDQRAQQLPNLNGQVGVERNEPSLLQ